MEAVKKCNTCNSDKRIECFAKKTGGSFGVRGTCKACINSQANTHRLQHSIRAINKELFKEGKKKCSRCGDVKRLSFYPKRANGANKLNPECKACYYGLKKYRDKVYQIKNAERISKRAKRYREKNKDIISTHRRLRYKEIKSTDSYEKLIERGRCHKIKSRALLMPGYVNDKAKGLGFDKSDINAHPEIIDIIKLNIKIKRLWKEKTSNT